MKKGFTLVEIMIVVAIIGIILLIAVPGFIRAREVSRARACQENLSKVDGAKEQWALEGSHGPADTPTWGALVGLTSYIKSTPACPGGANYVIGTIAVVPTCSYAEPAWAEPDFIHRLSPEAADVDS